MTDAAAILRSLSTPPDATWLIAVRTQSEANSRDHWRDKAKRAKAQRAHARMSVLVARMSAHKPSAVRLTRIAPRELDDDNYRAALKAIRDGLADAWGCDDSKRAGIDWQYGQQERGRPREYAVRVEVWRREP